MSKLDWKKVAIVCDWIKDWWWAEMVLKNIMEILPEADIYTSVFWQQWNKLFEWRKITTSFIQKIPFLNKAHKLAITLRPLAFESFDLSSYDIVISSSSAESKWIITKPETLHFCYCHTPIRYFWSHYHEYLNMLEFGILNPIAKFVMPRLIHKLRQWDYIAAQRVDYFIANSKNTASRIKKYYNKDAEVIYPGIKSEEFVFSDKKDDYYFYIWRAIPYKKFDLLIDAFNTNWKKLIVATNTDNKLYRELKAKSKSNITWVFNPPRTETRRLFAYARAFLFPPEEDFGIVPLEAMASGTPVIAFGKWWATETVIDKRHYLSATGIFFSEQTVESLNKTIEEFESKESEFDYKEIREYAYNFDVSNFKKKLVEFIESKL